MPTPTRPHVVLLGGTEASTRKAAGCGLSVINIEKPALFEPAAARHCVQTHLVDYQDVPLVTNLVRAIHRHTPLTRIVSQTEAGPLIAGHLTTLLGLDGNSGTTTRTLHDKLAFRAALNAAGLGVVDAAPATSRAQLAGFVARHGAAVVKPTMGSGSLGVRKVRSVAQVGATWEWLRRFATSPFMVEQLLEGTEVSVETISVAGRHTVLAVTGKDVGDGVVELGHVVPARLDEAGTTAVSDFTVRLLDAIGLVEGTAHTEVIITADGPRAIESHNRCAGDHIVDLMRLVYGTDLETLGYQLALPEGPEPVTPAGDGAAAVRFLTAEPGLVERVDGVQDALGAEGVVTVEVTAVPGQRIRPLNWSEDRCGMVIVRAGDSAEAERLAAHAAGLIRVRTGPAGAPAGETMGDLLSAAHEVLNPFRPEDSAGPPVHAGARTGAAPG
ncbi:ATP-grasp domain-containing protein [Actinoplanes sp. NPDC048796]|uniref:ATP-grasp domain-containing protein n=1 Tax=unclassified Actinoplanes TaxID=2626549 RepID=UPI0033EA59B8